MMKLAIHPLAEQFPEMSPEALRELAEDIKANGQLEPIVLLHGKILDGRNRAKACQIAGVEPRTVDFSVVELYAKHTPEEYVFSVNVKRRHLTASQRAAIAAELIPKLRRKTNPVVFLTPSPLPEVAATRSEAKEAAASVGGVNERYVHKARKLQIEDPETFREVKAGKKTITAATKAAKPAKRPKLPEAPSFFALSHTLGHLCAAWKRGDDYAPNNCCIERQTDGSLTIELNDGWGFRVWPVSE
jgi:hypothetical protein